MDGSVVGWMTSSISRRLVVLVAAPSLKVLSSASDVAAVISWELSASSAWLDSKYVSEKVTACARSAVAETCAMWKSNGLSPGANAFSKTALGIQSTRSGVKPISAATAYASAPSKPSPAYGSELNSISLQGEPPSGSLGYVSGAEPPHHG